jgi:[ribosomal protein S18]-alanine N-acetyltransferase
MSVVHYAELSAMPSSWAALQPQEADFAPMRAGELAGVMAIEQVAYTWPWSEGNVLDSILQGHRCMKLEHHHARNSNTDLLGYYIAMPGVDEVHLLNITVAPKFQRQGWARVMLDELSDWSRLQGAQWLWLEVRASNERARAIYERYYPLDGAQREDAAVMNLALR